MVQAQPRNRDPLGAHLYLRAKVAARKKERRRPLGAAGALALGTAAGAVGGAGAEDGSCSSSGTEAGEGADAAIGAVGAAGAAAGVGAAAGRGGAWSARALKRIEAVANNAGKATAAVGLSIL